jgi:hypothetical protein
MKSRVGEVAFLCVCIVLVVSKGFMTTLEGKARTASTNSLLAIHTSNPDNYFAVL